MAIRAELRSLKFLGGGLACSIGRSVQPNLPYERPGNEVVHSLGGHGRLRAIRKMGAAPGIASRYRRRGHALPWIRHRVTEALAGFLVPHNSYSTLGGSNCRERCIISIQDKKDGDGFRNSVCTLLFLMPRPALSRAIDPQNHSDHGKNTHFD